MLHIHKCCAGKKTVDSYLFCMRNVHAVKTAERKWCWFYVCERNCWFIIRQLNWMNEFRMTKDVWRTNNYKKQQQKNIGVSFCSCRELFVNRHLIKWHHYESFQIVHLTQFSIIIITNIMNTSFRWQSHYASRTTHTACIHDSILNAIKSKQ